MISWRSQIINLSLFWLYYLLRIKQHYGYIYDKSITNAIICFGICCFTAKQIEYY